MTATACRPRYPGRPRRAPVPREQIHQTMVMVWKSAMVAQDSAAPLRLLFATQNGLRTSLRQAVLAKRAGNVAGVPDLILPVSMRGYHGCWIELKAPELYDASGRVVEPAGKLSDEQRWWLSALSRAGHYATTCYGADATIACLRWYLGEDQGAVTRELHVALEFPREGGSRWKPVRLIAEVWL